MNNKVVHEKDFNKDVTNEKILIIIPAFNGEDSLSYVIENIIYNFPQYDYIIINDGSTDSTKSLCKEKGYECINLPVNLGLEMRLEQVCFMQNEKGIRYVVQIDGDGQHLPEYIENMIKKMEETGADIVISSRYTSNKKPLTMRDVGKQDHFCQYTINYRRKKG